MVIKMASSSTCWSLRKWSVVCLLLSLTFQHALGAFEKLEELDGVDGVTVVSINTVEIEENIGTAGFDFVKVILDAPADNLQAIGDGRFTVVRENGNNQVWLLRADGPFDYETVGQPPPIMLVNAGDPTPIYVRITNVNDNAPRYGGTEPPELQPTLELTQSELEKPVAKLKADDLDKDDTITFTLMDELDTFEIRNVDELWLKRQLNYSDKISHRLTIELRDDGVPSKETTAILTILVKDIPNNPPQFIRPPFISKVDEGTALNTEILKVEARDGDYELNWPIEFEISSDTLPHGLFEISPQGSIVVAKEIDAESKELQETNLEYSFVILAKEIYNPVDFPGVTPEQSETTYTVSFRIEDINDQPPLLCESGDTEIGDCKSESSYSFEIPEVHTGQISFDNPLHVKDIDSTNSYSRFRAEFAAGTPDFIKNGFSISPSSGLGSEQIVLVVKDSSLIDYESEDWHNTGDGQPKPVEFTIEITAENPSAIVANEAHARITATITDANDNKPEFEFPDGETQYVFFVCENSPMGDLKAMIVGDPNAKACSSATEGSVITVKATDKDISPEYSNVRYRWSSASRQPPIDITKDAGGAGVMSINNEANFDYERFTEDSFVLEAVDQEGEMSSTVVKFIVLDKNDVKVDLQFQKSTSASIPEETNNAELNRPVLDGIVASDIDTTADVEVKIEVNDVFGRNSRGFLEPLEMGALKADVTDWFRIVEETGNTPGSKAVKIVVNDANLPDREADKAAGEPDIERVNLRITASDINAETPDQATFQIVTITITDVNDNPPAWAPGEDYENRDISVLETEDWGEGEDPSSDYDREILILRVTDPDRDSKFYFEIDNSEDCNLEVPICEEINQFVELVNTDPKIGSAVLRRKKGSKIDRDDSDYFEDDGDFLKYTITVYDDAPEAEVRNKLELKVQILVDDRNDNRPIFVEDYVDHYEVDELEPEKFSLTIKATDDDRPDKYGKVSYVIVDDRGEIVGHDMFEIGVDTGVLIAKPNLPDKKFNWTDTNEYKVNVRAIDYYREGGSSSGSYSSDKTITISILDRNDHAPEFLTKPASEETLLERIETEVEPNQPFGETIMIRDLDNETLSNGKISVALDDVTKDPPKEGDPDDLKTLFILGDLRDSEPGKREKLIPIIPTQNFTGLWGTYMITITATDMENGDPEQKSTTETFKIEILNANLNAPIFEFPEDNTTLVYLSTQETKRDQPLKDMRTNAVLPAIEAKDEDEADGENGRVTYELVPENEQECNMFQIRLSGKQGIITTTRDLSDNDINKNCKLLINASDHGIIPKWSTVIIEFRLLGDRNSPPLFTIIPPPEVTPRFTVWIPENDAEIEKDLPYAVDYDVWIDHPIFKDGIVYYYIKGGDAEIFDLTYTNDTLGNGTLIQIPMLSPKAELDREEIDNYALTIYATNFENEPIEDVDPEKVDPENLQFMVVTVNVDDVIDTPPKFVTEGIITAGFSANTKTDSVITVVHTTDPDLEDVVTFQRTSNYQISHGSLPKEGDNPFEFANVEDRNMQIIIKFDPREDMEGYYTFQITATDRGDLTSTTTCQIYMVGSKNILKFIFTDTYEFVNSSRTEVQSILSNAFNYQCNIDRIFEDSAQKGTTVETHFIDIDKRVPVLASVIKSLQEDPEVFNRLTTELLAKGLHLAQTTNEDTNDGNPIFTFILIGAVAVLGITLLIVGATCFFNNRSLSRQVRVLGATAFGSQQSGLNRAGVTNDAPNTNAFAIEGSNPVWTIDSKPKTYPDFDAVSVGSGGSVLIGAEDEDYFQKSGKNPVFQAEDVVANYDSDNDNEVSDRRSYGHYSDEYEPDPRSSHNQNPNEGFGENPFGGRRTSRNPLSNIDMNMDVEEPEPEGFSFEGNTDASFY